MTQYLIFVICIDCLFYEVRFLLVLFFFILFYFLMIIKSANDYLKTLHNYICMCIKKIM